MDESKTSTIYTCISDDVISKVRRDLGSSGGLEETVLSELQAIWEMKMIQAGVISGTIQRSSASVPTPTLLETDQDPNPLPGYPQSGFDIDAQYSCSNPTTDLVMSLKKELEGLYIPQQDGTSDGDIVTKPNTDDAPIGDGDNVTKPNSDDARNGKDDEILNEDDDEILNEDDDEILNEDDDDEEDALDDDAMRIPDLALCQFDNVEEE